MPPPTRHPGLTNPLSPPTEALEAATASLSVEAQERAAKDAAKKAAKAEAAEQKHADKLAKSVVTIKRIERNKRKFVTAVIGLEAFGLDLKKVSLPFRNTSFFSLALSLSLRGGDVNMEKYHRWPRTSARNSRPGRP
jgi:density-regulated protein DRP1